MNHPCSLAVANRGRFTSEAAGVVSASPWKNSADSELASGAAAIPLLTVTGLCFEWNDITGSYDVEIICPVFHHCPTLSEIFGAVIGGTHGVLLLMSKLAFNHVRAEPHFIKCGGGHCSKAVNRRAAVIAHAV